MLAGEAIYLLNHLVHICNQFFNWCVLVWPGRFVGVCVKRKFEPVGIILPLLFITVWKLGQLETFLISIVNIEYETSAIPAGDAE